MEDNKTELDEESYNLALKMLKMLGEDESQISSFTVSKCGGVVSEVGKPNVKKIIKFAMTL